MNRAKIVVAAIVLSAVVLDFPAVVAAADSFSGQYSGNKAVLSRSVKPNENVAPVKKVVSTVVPAKKAVGTVDPAKVVDKQNEHYTGLIDPGADWKRRHNDSTFTRKTEAERNKQQTELKKTIKRAEILELQNRQQEAVKKAMK